MSNVTHNQTITDSQNNAWVESGAMVYIALTVASLSAVIMCCVWFFKHRLDKNRYGTVSTDGEHVELNSRDTQSDGEEEIDLTDSGSKTAVPVDEYKDAFTLEDPGSSSESDGNDEGDSDERGQVAAV